MKQIFADNLIKILFFLKQVAICVWPVLQTINFAFVHESNRVIFVSACSLIWTSFLAYMKQLKVEKTENQESQFSNR